MEKLHFLNTSLLCQGLRKFQQLYITSVGTASVTISGPPTIRRRFLNTSPYVKNSTSKDIPIKGPYHAPHLYTISDMNQLISPESAVILEQYNVIHDMISSTGAKKVSGGNTLDRLQETLSEILIGKIQWDGILKTCGTEIEKSSTRSCKVLTFGPSTMGNSLASSIKFHGISLTLEDHVSWTSKTRGTSSKNIGNMSNSKIAIVGISGRFPGAANLEEFWKLLEQGLDVCREVRHRSNRSVVSLTSTDTVRPF